MQSLEGIPTHGILIVHEASFFSRPHEMPWDAHCRFEINSRLTAPSLLLAKIVLKIDGIHAVCDGLGVFKPGALPPVTPAPIKELPYLCFFPPMAEKSKPPAPQVVGGSGKE